MSYVKLGADRLRKYKASKKESKQGDDTSSFEEEPHRRTLFIPTNSSVAAVIQQLDDNGGIGLIFDTECDTLSAALQNPNMAITVPLSARAFIMNPLI